MLPESVLQRAQSEFMNYDGCGVSVMELGSDTPEFLGIIRKAEENLRSLMNIPGNYKILFLQGGSSMQFSAIPMNLLSDHKCADYVVSGQHSKSAYIEAKKHGDIVIAASSAGATPAFSTVPRLERSDFRPDADYVHICYDNPIYGTTFPEIPDTGAIPLVADMSSYLLSQPIDINKFALIYASAHQCIGIAGMTIVIVRDDIIGSPLPGTPGVLDYKFLASNDIKYDTPPIWSIYIANLVFEWIQSIGGLVEIKRRNERKASLLYDYLDDQVYYTAPVDKKCRSMVNVIFLTGSAELDRKFIAEAKEEGLLNLAGDNSTGGIRASIYNGMPYDGALKLRTFMRKFADENPKLI